VKVNAEKAKYVVMYREQNAGQNHNTKIGNESFESVVQFRYFETTPTNKNYIREENSEQAEFRECLLPFGSDLSSALL